MQSILPCGMCGGESAQFSSDVDQLAGCAIWLENKQPRMRCKLAGSVKFAIGPAAKVSDNAPFTNRPVKCPECAPKPGVFHWSLNMAAHFARGHGKSMPAALEADIKVSEEQKKLVAKKFARK